MASAVEAEHDENELRKAFTVSERVAIGQAIEAEIGERRGRPSEEKCQEIVTYSGKRNDDIAAEKAGFGNRETYRQAKVSGSRFQVVSFADDLIIARTGFTGQAAYLTVDSICEL